MTTVEIKPKYLLDGSKIGWHTERVEAWEAGERFAPVSIDMALTRACQASCRGCYAVLQEPQERSNITVEHALNMLDDAAKIGVKAISLVSDGESSLSPAYVPFIEHASEVGVDVGNATNGWIWDEDMTERILPHLKWVRFTVLAGTPEKFAEMMYGDPSRTDLYDKMVENISRAVAIKERDNLDVTLGIQTFITPEDGDGIRAFAQLGVDLKADYAVIKHMSDDEFRSFGVKYDYENVYGALHEAEAMSNDRTSVQVKWSKIRMGEKPPYKRFYGPPFLLQISGSGLVAPSGMFFNARYSKLHIGNFTEERFRDIFNSYRYWDAMNYLASERFDAQTMLGALPIQHYVSVDLDRHVKGEQRIEPRTDDVPHRNFL